jgi:hypothetical protein
LLPHLLQRIHKTLTEANIRLDSVLSDIMGASSRRIIEAMIAGVRDPRKLAALAGRGVKATPKELYDALHGRLTDHHRFLLKLHLGQWDALSGLSRELDSGRTRVGGLGSCSGRSCRPPILKRFASESAERIAGNEMALDVERVLDGGVTGQEPLC